MSMSARYKLLKETLEKYPVSGIPKDLYIEYFLIDMDRELTEIVELGAGSGNWSLMIDKLTKCDLSYQKSVKSIRHFHQVENFNYLSHSSMSYVYEDLRWSTNKEDLVNHITTSSIDLTGTEINTTYHFVDVNDFLQQDFGKKFHVVRLDCDIDNYDYFWSWVYKNTAERFIVIIDDTAPNYCPERFYSAMQETIDSGILNPFWYGINSGAWCNFDPTETQQYILELAGHLYDHIRIRNGVLITR
jgi:hypothetical protein